MTKQEILLKLDLIITDCRRSWAGERANIDIRTLADAFEAIKEVFEDLLPDFALSNTLKPNRRMPQKPKNWAEIWQYVVEDLGMTNDDARYLWNNWKANGFSRNGQPIKDWKAAARAWKAAKFYPSQKQKP